MNAFSLPLTVARAAASIDRYWAIDGDRALGYAELVAAQVMGKTVPAPTGEDRPPYALIDGVAVVSIEGLMTKRPAPCAEFLGGCATENVRDSLIQAVNDPEVRAILLYVDSPGGTVSGTAALANEVEKAAKAKPVVGYISDYGCSGAYWVASQCPKLFAGPTATVGSIGIKTTIHDTSKAAEAAGVVVHVVDSGGHKGDFEDGTKVTGPQIDELRRMIFSLRDKFVQAIAAGRNMTTDQAMSLADGRVHIGAEAVSLGLVDGVCTEEEAFNHALSLANPAPQWKSPYPRKWIPTA